MNRSMWNAEVETISEAEQAAMERNKLVRQIDYGAGLAPRDVRGPQDLSSLPFTTKAELRESQEREPPFGDYLASSRELVTTVHRSSGSTGKFYRSKIDGAGLAPRDVRGPQDLSSLPFTTKAELRGAPNRCCHRTIPTASASSLRVSRTRTAIRRLPGFLPRVGDDGTQKLGFDGKVHLYGPDCRRHRRGAVPSADKDMEQTNECGARAFWAAGLRPRHTVVHCLNYSLWMGGFTDQVRRRAATSPHNGGERGPVRSRRFPPTSEDDRGARRRAQTAIGTLCGD